MPTRKSKNLTPKETLIVIVFTLMNLSSSVLMVSLGTMTWDRQYVVVVLKRATVFDRWDAFGLPKPQPIGAVEPGSQLPVLIRFHSIEGGGIRVRLPQGSYGHLVPFDSGGDDLHVRSFEPVSIVIFVTLGVIVAWAWLLVLIKEKLATGLVLATILLPQVLSANLLLLWGKV